MDDEGRSSDPRVLVAVATKYGSTYEIGTTIAHVLSKRAIEADVTRVDEIQDLAGFDAVVLGSSIYAGAWLKQATRFAVSRQADLSDRKVWLFSSGILGRFPAQDDPRQVPDIYAAIDARDHRMFFGKLDKDAVKFFDRVLIRLMKAPYGDFRVWSAIEEWAHLIADDLEVG